MKYGKDKVKCNTHYKVEDFFFFNPIITYVLRFGKVCELVKSSSKTKVVNSELSDNSFPCS